MCHWTANVRCKICFVEWQQLSLTVLVYIHACDLFVFVACLKEQIRCLTGRCRSATVLFFGQWLEIGDCERRLGKAYWKLWQQQEPLGPLDSKNCDTLWGSKAYAFQVANHLTGQVEVENSKEILRIAKHVCIDGISWVSLAIFPHILGINKPLLTNTGLISNRRPAASWPISFDDSGHCQFAAGQRSSTKGTLALVLFISGSSGSSGADMNWKYLTNIGSYLGIWWNMQIDADRL